MCMYVDIDMYVDIFMYVDMVLNLLNNYCRRGICCGGRFRFICMWTVFGKTKKYVKHFSGCV